MTKLRELDRRHPGFARMGWVMLALVLLSLAMMTWDGRMILGVSVWAKPAKFAASFVLWFWTLAWLWPLVPQRRAAAWISRLMLGAAGFEQIYITARAALGQASHFNIGDPFSAAMYALMGVAATLLVGLCAVLGVMVLRGGALDGERLAAGLGLLITGLVGGAAGWAISLHGGPWVGGTPGNGAGWPIVHWSRDGGDLRTAHFLGMHAMQVLPPLALVLRSRSFISVAAFAWAGLSLVALRMALAGQPWP